MGMKTTPTKTLLIYNAALKVLLLLSIIWVDLISGGRVVERELNFNSSTSSSSGVPTTTRTPAHDYMAQKPKLESQWFEDYATEAFFEGEDNHDGGSSVAFNDDTIVVSSAVSSLQIVCSAQYPIYWDYDIGQVFSALTREVPEVPCMLQTNENSELKTNTHRTSEDFDKPNTYKFYAYLRLSGDSRRITGNYTCRSATNETLQTSRYIFWKVSVHSSTLVHFGSATTTILIGAWRLYQDEMEWETRSTACATPSCRGLPSKTVMADRENKTIILPCSVAPPESEVVLYKQSSRDYTLYNEIKLSSNGESSGVSWDPRVGFTLDLTALEFVPYGIFKCSVVNSKEHMLVMVTREIPKDGGGAKLENNTLVGNAKFTFDHDLQRHVCCSNSAQPPKIYTKTCRTKYECDKFRRKVQNFEHLDPADDRFGNCRSSNLTTGLFAGVIRCVGNGIDVTREYVVPSIQYVLIMSNLSKIYYEELTQEQKADLIVFASSTLHSPFVGRTYHSFKKIPLTLYCHPSVYLYSHGARWSIEWKNGSRSMPPVAGGDIASYHHRWRSMKPLALDLRVTDEILSVTCHAPLSNSFDWVAKTLTLNLTEPILPTVVGPAHETLTFNLGNSNAQLVCQIEGDPLPFLSWTKPVRTHANERVGRNPWAHTFDPNQVESGSILNGTIILTFSKVLARVAGRYTCQGTSSAGTIEKIFDVFVKDADEHVREGNGTTGIWAGNTTRNPNSDQDQVEERPLLSREDKQKQQGESGNVISTSEHDEILNAENDTTPPTDGSPVSELGGFIVSLRIVVAVGLICCLIGVGTTLFVIKFKSQGKSAVAERINLSYDGLRRNELDDHDLDESSIGSYEEPL